MCSIVAILWPIMFTMWPMLSESLARVTKLSYHLFMMAHDAPRPPEASAGLPGAVAGHSVWTLKRGDRLPSEAELVRTFGCLADHGRARRQRLAAQGLVERRAGSGTYVSGPRAAGALSFGLLIPDLGETDIFEPVCQGMMASPLARTHALVWGSSAEQECRSRIAPGSCAASTSSAEWTASSSRRSSSLLPDDRTNQRIAHALDAAHIPIVLLDRHRHALSASADTTISSASTTAARASDHVEHVLVSAAGASRSSASRTLPPRSKRARLATAKRSTPPLCQSIARSSVVSIRRTWQQFAS